MKVIDMHCDTLMIAYLLKKKDLFSINEQKPEMGFFGSMVDFQKMKLGQGLAQFFAVCLLPEEMKTQGGVKAGAEEYISCCVGILKDSVKMHNDIIEMAYNAEDILENQKRQKMSAVLTMEDGSVVQNNMDNISRYYYMGFRAIGLMWKNPNCFGWPDSDNRDLMNHGLTEFGKEAVPYIQQLGMLVDVSHLSDGGFYDVSRLSKKPFVATHSNCRELCPHSRNLSDDMIRLLADKGGVVGLNFAPEFLDCNVNKPESTANLIAKHAAHMKNTGGIDCVAIGTDFDGIGGNLEIKNCSEMDLLLDALRKEGFSEGEMDKICYKNVLRVMRDGM